jgi:hypothetical protein
MGASALTSFVSYHYLVLLGLVGKRKLFLLCIRLPCTVPLFTASIFPGTSVGPLESIGRDTTRLDTVFFIGISEHTPNHILDIRSGVDIYRHLELNPIVSRR